MYFHASWKIFEELIIELDTNRASRGAIQLLIQRYAQISRNSERRSRPSLHDQYLCFVVANFAMSYYRGKRELTEMHSWIIRGLTDNYEGTQVEDVDSERVLRFIGTDAIRRSPFFHSVLTEWLTSLYYYCAEQTALDDLGEKFFDVALRMCVNTHPKDFDDNLAFMTSRLMTWAVQTGHRQAKEVTTLCEKLARSSAASTRVRTTMSSSLSTNSGRLSEKDRAFWARYTLNNFRRHLKGHELLHQIQVLWDGAPNNLHHEIISEVQKIRHGLVESCIDPIEYRMIEDNWSELIKPVLGKAVEKGNYEFLHSLVAAWHGISDRQLLPADRLLWQSPFSHSGYFAIAGDKLVEIKRENQEILVRLTLASNRFLGSSVSVRGQPSDEIYIPERFGQPLEAVAPEFEQALCEAFFPAAAAEVMRESAALIVSQIVIPSKPYPLQAVQLKYLGNTWPLTSSFQEPLPDADVQRVAIWSAGGLMAGDLELSSVAAVFSRAGIEVVVFEGSNNGICFEDVYSDNTFDLIWLISHGEYDHFSPKDARLIVDEGSGIGLNTLLKKRVERTSRRLIFLNVCDGATHPGEGALPRLGFAASLASPFQATISHKWPVATITGAAFGTLLAIELAKRNNYFTSFKNVISTMSQASSGSDLADIIESSIEQRTSLCDRLSHSSQDFAALSNFSSAAFFA